MSAVQPEALVAAVRAGDRRALARAITLIESTRGDHRAVADLVVAELLPASGTSLRIGVSGAPGAGKSTLIEALGLHVIEAGHRVAVLAVDVSSKRGGGAILGDKTRMERLANEDQAFVRPSPSGGTLGGVARRTREAIVLCEAAEYDVLLVETVGVGQSETAVADMVDLFMLLLQPGGGDELQGIKRGIVELADLVAVNKADGAFIAAATATAAEYAGALHLLRPRSPHWSVPVLTCSAATGGGIAELWQAIERYRIAMTAAAALAARRVEQARHALWAEVEASLLAALRADRRVKPHLAELEARVAVGEITPSRAADALLAAFLGRGGDA